MSLRMIGNARARTMTAEEVVEDGGGGNGSEVRFWEEVRT
jgi:hypothetical protein